MKTLIKEKHHHRGSFEYEVSVLPSMTKGEIVGQIVIDVNRYINHQKMLVVWTDRQRKLKRRREQKKRIV
jgi:hypothetical protein